MRPDDREDPGTRESEGDSDAADTDTDAEEWQFGADGPIAPPITPGSPSLEHVVFVLLGVAITLLALAQLVL